MCNDGRRRINRSKSVLSEGSDLPLVKQQSFHGYSTAVDETQKSSSPAYPKRLLSSTVRYSNVPHSLLVRIEPNVTVSCSVDCVAWNAGGFWVLDAAKYYDTMMVTPFVSRHFHRHNLGELQ